ncbi:FxLYD domain-containing protein [Haloterrigena salinisoli]|uniref:FxLYD domain-containing protein n=1 Tax=Haloterrigena salinisoli TaxID=3132747 RepID=UPI0030D215BE
MKFDRRQFIALGATSLIAGCIGDSDSDDEGANGNNDPNNNSSTSNNEEGNNDSEGESENTGEPSIEITNHELVTYEGEYDDRVYAHGWIENSGDAVSGFVEGEAVFYDDSGEELGVETSSLIGVPAGDTWEVFIEYFGDGSPSDYDFDASHDSGTTPSYGVPSAELVDSSLDTTGNVKITGTVENTSDASIDYVEANPHFYAENGNLLWRGMTNVTELGAGETWEFSNDFLYNGVAEIEDRVTDYEVRIQS